MRWDLDTRRPPPSYERVDGALYQTWIPSDTQTGRLARMMRLEADPAWIIEMVGLGRASANPLHVARFIHEHAPVTVVLRGDALLAQVDHLRVQRLARLGRE